MSYSFGVFYVRAEDGAELRQRYGRVDEAGGGWLACGFGDRLMPDDVYEDGRADRSASAAAALSAVHGEAIYLWADSSGDELVYDHAKDGVLLRKLLWTYDGCESSWECAAGEPEPWEEVLFASRNLEQRLASVEPEEHEAVRAVYGARRIEAGARYPSCDASVAEVIERHFGLTRPSNPRR